MSRTFGGRAAVEYEKVAVDEWLPGMIETVQLQEDRPYRHTNDDTGETEMLTAPHVRFKFKLDGYKYPHYSRWMKASTHKKSNLYSKYLRSLCPTHDCENQQIDVDKLTGVRIKIMWENNGDYQNVTQIRGLDAALDVRVDTTAPEADPDPANDVPF